MSNFPLRLDVDEMILKTDENAAFVRNNALGLGYNVIFGTLWLTTHRIVFQSSVLGRVVTYPLSRIAKATRSEVTISQKQTQYAFRNYDAALRVEFDNGGREYFIPQNIADWATAIADAKTAAPEMQFTQAPPSHSAVEQGGRGVGVIAAIMLGIVLLFLCTAAICVGLPVLLSLFGQK